MSKKKCQLTYALGTLAMCASLILAAPTGAENSLTVDPSTQPHLKSWSNIIPNTTRRFIVLSDFGNQAALDRETGLVWELNPAEDIRDWGSAQFFCINKSVGGRKGWRLPSIPELASLIDPAVASPGPTLPVGHPFGNVQTDGREYFSATTVGESVPGGGGPTVVWGVYFFNGGVTILSKTTPDHVWCVRGPMNADTY